MPRTPSQPSWEAYEEDLGEEWNVFTATLHNQGIRSTFKLARAVDLGSSNAREAFRGHVAALLREWLSGSAIGDSGREAFKLLVAMTPGRPHRLAFFARPMPEDCQRLPEVHLVQRVLHEVFDVQASPAVVVAIYAVDLLEDEASGQRFQLSGPAVNDPKGANRIVHAILRYLMRRRPESLPIQHGHRLRISYLSNERVGISFPQRRVPVEQATLDRLPNLWDATVADLRARLAHDE